MKNIIFSILIIFSAFLFSNVESAKATCPSGFTQIKDTITFDGCLYKVTMCVKCFVTHQGEVIIDDIEPLPNQAPPCDVKAWQNFNNAVIFINGFVQAPMYYFNKLCSTMPLSPCDQQSNYTTVSYREYFCWMKTVIGFEPCDKENYCEVTIDFCHKATGPVIINKKSFIVENNPPYNSCPEYTGKNH